MSVKMDVSILSQRNVHHRYAKLDFINEGRFAAVYKARDEETGEIVALKRIRLDNEDEVKWDKTENFNHSLKGNSMHRRKGNFLAKRIATSKYCAIAGYFAYRTQVNPRF